MQQEQERLTMAGKLDQIIVVDVEATCWEDRPPENTESEIIEIGLCVVDVRRRERIARASLLVRPTHSHVSPFCTRLTTLTPAQVDQGLPFAEACQRLAQHYRTTQRTWASWGDYDRRQFERQCQRERVQYPFGPTHLNLKNLFALVETLEYEDSLAQALDRYDMRYEGTPHRGVDDAWNIAGLLVQLLHRGKRPP
jgi:inhibitor of KinA sporulation pathway (predicted exonuclease)